MSLIPLPAVPSVLREMTGCTGGPTYGLLYRLGLAGRLPVITAYGRHFVEAADLPEIARLLDLKRGQPVPGGLPRVTVDRRLKEPPAAPRRRGPLRPEAQERTLDLSPRYNARAWSNFIKAHGRDPSPDEFAAASRSSTPPAA